MWFKKKPASLPKTNEVCVDEVVNIINYRGKVLIFTRYGMVYELEFSELDYQYRLKTILTNFIWR